MNKLDQDDFVGAGFKRLDDNLWFTHPPHIQWGKLFLKWPDHQKIEHLKKLAETMNEAAAKIQEERNKLLTLCDLKEQQLVQMAKQRDANNAMLQQEVTRMNEDRQLYNQAVAKLNAKIRTLTKQVEALTVH